MILATSTQDIIKNSILKLVPQTIDPISLIIAMIVSALVGAGYYYIALICFVFVTLAFLILKGIKDENKTFVLVVNYQNQLIVDEEVRRLLLKNKFKLRSKIIKNDLTELTVEITMKTENTSITNDLAEIDGVKGVTLVHYRGNYEL